MDDTVSSRARKLNYPPELIEPITAAELKKGAGILSPAPDVVKWQRYREKIEALFSYYRIDGKSYEDLLQLAFNLALDWVPGFEIVESARRKPGAPKRNDEDALVKVYREIDELRRASKSKQIGAACKKFLSINKDEARWAKMNPRSLENLFNRGKRISLSREASARRFGKLHMLSVQEHPQLSGLLRLGDISRRLEDYPK
jgi:hypothetical protein